MSRTKVLPRTSLIQLVQQAVAQVGFTKNATACGTNSPQLVAKTEMTPILPQLPTLLFPAARIVAGTVEYIRIVEKDVTKIPFEYSQTYVTEERTRHREGLHAQVVSEGQDASRLGCDELLGPSGVSPSNINGETSCV